MEKKLRSLRSNHAGVMKLKNGQKANYGNIRVENDKFVHYTGKGLREMWPAIESEKSKELKKLDEATLIKLGHIAITPILEIVEVIN